MYDEAYSSSEGDEDFPENRVQKKAPRYMTSFNASTSTAINTDIRRNGTKLTSGQQEPVYGSVASVVKSSASRDLSSASSSTSDSDSSGMSASKADEIPTSLQKLAKREFIQSKETHFGPDSVITEKNFSLAAPTASRKMVPPATSPVNERTVSDTPPIFPKVGSATVRTKAVTKTEQSSDEEDLSDDDDDEEEETEPDPNTNVTNNEIEGLYTRNSQIRETSSSSGESLQFDPEDDYYNECLKNDPDVGTVDFKDLSKLMQLYGGHAYTELEDIKQDKEDEDTCLEELYNYYVDDESWVNVDLNQRFHEMKLEKKRERLRKKYPLMSKYTDMYGYDCRMYNATEYENLKVNADIKELFQYITQYSYQKAAQPKRDVKLKPFLPEYYPSVGDIDGFLKIVHPEVENDQLGIKSLDEPAPFQSDPSVLDLRLRSLAKQSSAKSVVVKKVDNVGKNTKIIENWIKDISDLHRSKPSPSVHYSKPMPDIDSLIQEWPAEIEDLLQNASFPSPELECDLKDYIDIVCNLLDIPIYKSRIQSLHVLCTLYATLRHFTQYGPPGMGMQTEVPLPSNSLRYGEKVDHLQLM